MDVQRPAELDAWLEKVTVAYERGLLVPFIGAGMSAGICHLWDPFIAKLERRAGVRPAAAVADQAQRAARAVRRLRFGSGEGLAGAVAVALLCGRPGHPPLQTARLASIFWPLVVTTNYDDLYVAAAHEAFLKSDRRIRRGDTDKRAAPLLLLGRSPDDCQRVLVSLRQPDVPILWALQGFIGGQALALASRAGDSIPLYVGHAFREQSERLERLRGELVVGHAEYRRVAMASEPFRRAFAELYRSRSLLFLGSGLRDKYFLDLFSEVIELYGPSPHAHYALVSPEEKVDATFLQQYLGIWACAIEHEELPDVLREIEERINGARPRQLSWQFGRARAARPGERPAGRSGLRVVRSPLPADVAEGECIVFSGGGTRKRFSLSSVAKTYRDKHGRPLDDEQFPGVDEDEAEDAVAASGTSRKTAAAAHTTSFVRTHVDDRRFLALNARIDPWTVAGARIRPVDPTRKPFIDEKRTAGGPERRDLRLLPLAVEALMSATQDTYTHLHTMLLAAGPARTFPQSHALMQMVRGWARWQETAAGSGPDLSIYVIARDVLYDLDAGRLDLTPSLTPDVVEFWVEIDARDAEPERYLEVAPADRSLRKTLADFAVEGDDWTLDVIPHPSLMWRNWTVAGITTWEAKYGGSLTLETFGVLPGSTLRLAKPPVASCAGRTSEAAGRSSLTS